MQTTIAEFEISKPSEVREAGQRARLLATLVDLPNRHRTWFGRAVHEIVAAVHQQGRRGRITFRLRRQHGDVFAEAAVWHSGGDSDNISLMQPQPAAGASDPGRAGTDRTYVEADTVADGNIVRIGVAVSPDVASSSSTEVAEWAGILRLPRIHSALASTQRRTRALAEELASLQRQRQELESELQRSRSVNETLTLLSLVASKTDNAVIIMDADGRTTWVNDAYIRMTGFTVQDSLGRRPDQLLSGPETAAESLAELDRAFQLGHGLTEELLQQRADGSTSWISLSLTPVHNEDGSVSRWIGIGADITRRREVQRALEDARNAAEKASRLKGEFLANISHEIRTPMNAIIGMTDLALCTQLDEDQQDYLTTVKVSAEALLELLNDVLDLSRIESGRMELDVHATRVPQLLAETLKPMKVIADQKQLRLSWHMADDVPEWIDCDPLRLRQILINLAGNAIKFTDQGSVEIKVTRRLQADGSAELAFEIADTGIGIAPDKQQKIFDAFSQADASVTRQFGGTGLGLAISSELVHLMHGRIKVHSEPGRGSSFRFTIPLQLPAADRRRAASPPTSQAMTEHFGRPLTVLVADDHEANRLLIGRILEKRGHRAAFARDGRETIRCFRSQDFDVILMDVQMPRMDGYQATAEIRELERDTHTHIPIIAVTAHAMEGERDICLSAGMDAWLPKPVSSSELITLIESLSNNQINLSATAATATGVVAVDESQDSAGTVVSQPDEPALAQQFAGALRRLDGDRELLREQMQFFLTDGPMLMQTLEQSSQLSDLGRQRIAAHRLKNLCATFDDEQTAGLCHQVELLDAAADSNLAATRVAEVRAGVNRLLEAIRLFHDRSGRGT